MSHHHHGLPSSNVTAGFIDLATFDELDKYLYGGQDATAYFVRETRKATWFTQVPVALSRATGQPDFGSNWSVAISRAGDYLLHAWLRVTTPQVAIAAPAVGALATAPMKTIRWTRNFMHNLVQECQVTFNDLVAARFDSYHLDFWTAFTVPAGKRNGYDNMIGNLEELITPQTLLPSVTLNLPLPLFFARDSGVALPTAALPYNEMRLNFGFRNWSELLIVDEFHIPPDLIDADDSVHVWKHSRPAQPADLAGGLALTLTNCNVWANYAIVSNDERKRMACAPRDILIEQVQSAPRQTFTPRSNANQQFDIRFSHAIKVLFFAVRNRTCESEHSNYTCHQPTISVRMHEDGPKYSIDFTAGGKATDPIGQTSLIYENTHRLAQMGSDYFSLVNPYYSAPVIPAVSGYHMYSYSLNFIALDPMGSTNYGKLTNVSISPEASESAIASQVAPEDRRGQRCPGRHNNYEFITTAVNNNIIRISGGALGFPVL